MRLCAFLRYCREMENIKRILKYVFTISDKVRLISFVEKGDREKCEIAHEFNILPNTLSSINELRNRKIKC